MNQGIGLIADLAIVIVMCLSVYYSVRLNRALNRARDGRAELIQLIASLSEALARADIAVKTMKGTATEYELSLQKNMAATKGMIEELSLINDTGNAIANRLERLAPLARAGVAEMSYEVEPPRGTSHRGSLPPLRAERLGEAPRAATKTAVEPVRAAPVVSRAMSAADKSASGPSVVSMTRATGADGAEKPRSRAERELFDALETLRKGKPS